MDTKQADDTFWGMVAKGQKCWKWTGTVNGKGYGVYDTGQRLEYAHRYAYFALVGDVLPGQRLYNVCHDRLCVNPSHWSTEKPIQRPTMQYKPAKQAKMGNSRLTRPQAIVEAQAMREAYSLGNVTQAAIATRYKLSQAQVSRILSERSR